MRSAVRIEETSMERLELCIVPVGCEEFGSTGKRGDQDSGCVRRNINRTLR